MPAAFRSYGQVLILNLDGGYALVLTGLETHRRPGRRNGAGWAAGRRNVSFGHAGAGIVCRSAAERPAGRSGTLAQRART